MGSTRRVVCGDCGEEMGLDRDGHISNLNPHRCDAEKQMAFKAEMHFRAVNAEAEVERLTTENAQLREQVKRAQELQKGAEDAAARAIAQWVGHRCSDVA